MTQNLMGQILQATDIEIHAKETLKIKSLLNGLYHKHTGQELGVIERSMERDNFMDPETAKDFGIIDQIIETRQLPINVSSKPKN